MKKDEKKVFVNARFIWEVAIGNYSGHCSETQAYNFNIHIKW